MPTLNWIGKGLMLTVTNKCLSVCSNAMTSYLFHRLMIFSANECYDSLADNQGWIVALAGTLGELLYPIFGISILIFNMWTRVYPETREVYFIGRGKEDL